MKMSFRGVSCLMTGAAFVTFAFLSPNCQPTGGTMGGENGNGGDASGGNTGSGGNTNNGGSSANNGGSSSSNGGSSASNGGSNNNGGSSASNGGSSSKGGSSASNGGSNNNGGSSASNGGSTPSNGGSSASNGGTVSSNGGSTSTSTSSTPTGTAVAFGAGKGQGAMTGYAFVALGALDALTSPTCGATKAAITKATPCLADTAWSSTSALCISGSIPALGTPPDYTGNWGVSVGLNSTDPAGSGLGQSFTSITIALSGTPTSGLRALVHKKGESVDTSYCATLTPGTAIPLTSFSATCYDTAKPGTAITAADVPNIDQVTVQVSSGAAAITVANLCITGITFAK